MPDNDQIHAPIQDIEYLRSRRTAFKKKSGASLGSPAMGRIAKFHWPSVFNYGYINRDASDFRSDIALMILRSLEISSDFYTKIWSDMIQEAKRISNTRESGYVGRDSKSESGKESCGRYDLIVDLQSQNGSRFNWSIDDKGVLIVEGHGEPNSEQIFSAEDILERMDRADAMDRRRLIIGAEAIHFEGEDRGRIVELLKEYILENRNTNDQDELIAVASATRKCVALLDATDMDWLSTLLESGHRVPSSLDLELEIAKMICRRYSASPPEHSDPYPALSDQLAEIARDYLRPRIFSHERVPTVAMLATQAMLVMRSKQARNILNQVNNLPFGWFRRQLRRRMDQILRQMPTESTAAQELGELVQAIDPG